MGSTIGCNSAYKVLDWSCADTTRKSLNNIRRMWVEPKAFLSCRAKEIKSALLVHIILVNKFRRSFYRKPLWSVEVLRVLRPLRLLGTLMSQTENLLLGWLNLWMRQIWVLLGCTKLVLQMRSKESWLVFWSTSHMFALVWNGVQTLSFVLEFALEVTCICRAFHVVVFSVFVGRSARWFELLADCGCQHDLDISLKSGICLSFCNSWRHLTKAQRLRRALCCVFKGRESGGQTWEYHFFRRSENRIHSQLNQLLVLESRPADRLENIVSVLPCQENRIQPILYFLIFLVLSVLKHEGDLLIFILFIDHVESICVLLLIFFVLLVFDCFVSRRLCSVASLLFCLGQ